MKGAALSLVLICIAWACSQRTDNQAAENNGETKVLPRIAIAGLAIESSTFSPARTLEEAFHAKTGDEIFSLYPFLPPLLVFFTSNYVTAYLLCHLSLPYGLIFRTWFC